MIVHCVIFHHSFQNETRHSVFTMATSGSPQKRKTDSGTAASDGDDVAGYKKKVKNLISDPEYRHHFWFISEALALISQRQLAHNLYREACADAEKAGGDLMHSTEGVKLQARKMQMMGLYALKQRQYEDFCAEGVTQEHKRAADGVFGFGGGDEDDEDDDDE